MADYKKAVPHVQKWEGGYVNDPDDRGGETNKGITIGTWRSYGYDTSKVIPELKVGKKTYRNVTDSLYHMTEEQWDHIFKSGYWDRIHGDQIRDQSVATFWVDWYWNSGVSAIKSVQRLLGVSADGIVGKKTITALNAQNPRDLFGRMRAARTEFVEGIVKRSPSQGKFLKGWLNRINYFQYGM